MPPACVVWSWNKRIRFECFCLTVSCCVTCQYHLLLLVIIVQSLWRSDIIKYILCFRSRSSGIDFVARGGSFSCFLFFVSGQYLWWGQLAIAEIIAECCQWIGYNSWNTLFRRFRGPALSFPFETFASVVLSLCLPNSRDPVSGLLHPPVTGVVYRVMLHRFTRGLLYATNSGLATSELGVNEGTRALFVSFLSYYFSVPPLLPF